MIARIAIIFVIALALTGCTKASERVASEAETMPTGTETTVAETAVMEPSQPAGAEQPKDLELGTAEQKELTKEAKAFEKPTTENIQKALKNAGLYEGKIDGIMGPRTKKAVKDFQSKNNLAADGKVGPKTWSLLKEYLNKTEEPSPSETKE